MTTDFQEALMAIGRLKGTVGYLEEKVAKLEGELAERPLPRPRPPFPEDGNVVLAFPSTVGSES